MKSYLHLGILISTGSSALFAMPVHAQDEAQDGTARPSISEIVVTARRREESIQDVPVAITALSGADLENKMLRSTDDLRNFVPSVNISGLKRDNSDFYIRGQGPGSLVTGQRNFSSVATYFAEVPTSIAGPGVFYDLANVQILKGPQGTLFGRNTTGGAVLFEPNAPTWDNEGSVQLQFGNYNFKQFDGVINIAPVPDKIAIRAAVEISRRDGFTQSIYTGQKLDNRHYEGARFSVRLAPLDGFESTTIVNYRNRDQSGTSEVVRALDPNAAISSIAITPAIRGALAATGVTVPTNLNAVPITTGGTISVGCTRAALAGCPAPIFGQPALGAIAAALQPGASIYLLAPTSTYNQIMATQAAIGPRKNQQLLLGIDKSREWSVINRTKIEVTDDITLKNVISYQKTRQQFQYDFDGTQLQILDSQRSPNEWQLGSEQFTEEFQVQGRIPSINLEYLAGVYYEREKPGFDMVSPGIQVGALGVRTFNHLDTSKAVFGHLEWNPSSFFGISGGVRRTWDSRVSSISKTGSIGGACTQTIPGTSTFQCPIEYSGKFAATTYDGTISLHPVQNMLVYASYRHGYKSGGFNLPAPDAPAPLPANAYQKFDPEYVNEIELGAKGSFEFGTAPLQFELAYFRDSYKNVQTTTQVPFPNVVTGQIEGAIVILNGANAKNQGLEFSGTIIPFKGLKLSGFMSYIDAHFTTTVPGATIAGRQMRNTPKWKYGFSGAYTLPLDERTGEVTLSADYSHQSSTFADNAGAVFIPSDPGYGLLNLRLSWNRVMSSNLDLAVFGTNVTDKVYLIGGYPVTQLGFQAGVYGEPRMYGGSIKYHF